MAIGRPKGGIVTAALVGLVRFYQRVVSPLKPAPSCRFYPSCSAYALEALELHGAWRGSWLALRRLSKCHPFHAGGLDVVPPRVVKAQEYRVRAKQLVASVLEDQ